MAPDHVNPEHIHLHGGGADRVTWSLGRRLAEWDDDWDGAALERAMVESRRSVYSELSTLGAA